MTTDREWTGDDDVLGIGEVHVVVEEAQVGRADPEDVLGLPRYLTPRPIPALRAGVRAPGERVPWHRSAAREDELEGEAFPDRSRQGDGPGGAWPRRDRRPVRRPAERIPGRRGGKFPGGDGRSRACRRPRPGRPCRAPGREPCGPRPVEGRDIAAQGQEIGPQRVALQDGDSACAADAPTSP